MKVGVLGLQGDRHAHARILQQLGVADLNVVTAADLAAVDALIIPGGESTSMRIIAKTTGLMAPLREAARAGMPILGTCAGLIACASHLVDGDEPMLGHVDIDVERNAYGRQNQSFETDVEFEGLGEVHAVFIRAPRISRLGADVHVMAVHQQEPVAARQGSTWLLAFHPEIAGETRIHEAWLNSIK